jgi:hypothetical protein
VPEELRRQPEPRGLPPPVGEDHVCRDCAMSYAQLEVDAAVVHIETLPESVRAAVGAVPPQLLRHRPGPGVWSVVEYVCHLRDVYITSTIRLHRARTEDRPTVEPMLNDLRARRFHYNDADVHAVLDQLTATARGCREEISRFRLVDWRRPVIRMPGEERTSRWLVRQAAHEGQHHLGDIRRLATAGSTAFSW